MRGIGEENEKTQRMAEKEKKMMETSDYKPSIGGNQKLNNESEKDLIDMIAKHRTEALVHNNLNQLKHHQAELEIGRDAYERTTSMISFLSGVEEDEIISQKYKYVTAAVLGFCYFSLALNDFIFGPTFDDLSTILSVDFAKISYFTIIRQSLYTCGALGGIGFNYVNRQLSLAILLIISAFTLIATPFSTSLEMFFTIAAINGFAAGACDIGFHVWIIEMFEDGGGPLLQALHFSFGIGITIAPSITAAFLSGESSCSTLEEPKSLYDIQGSDNPLNNTSVFSKRQPNTNLYIPYVICAVIVCLGGIALIVLYIYKKYVPPRQPKAPPAFAEEMPNILTNMEKFELWKQSIPSSYSITLVVLGSLLLLFYYGLEVTYFQFMAQFITATPLPIQGTASALIETASGAAYALGGAVCIYLSTRLHPQQMIYFNFGIINIGSILLIMFYKEYISMLWIGNVLVGLGFSSTYATAYTFLEHHIPVNNAIGSIFVLAGGGGTAIFPLLLTNLCEDASPYIIMCLTCGECIKKSVDSHWCEANNFGQKSRCNSESELLKSKCPKNQIIGKKPENNDIVKDNRPFSEAIDRTVQLKPQKYEISLKVGQKVSIPIQFRQAVDYPMDLYYLMDLSCTMKKHKKSLARVGKSLAQKMKDTTKNFRIGFGSFVDKPLMPFSNFKIEPITCDDSTGEPPYSFQHKLTLTDKEDIFVNQVESADTSGNLDSPEGTLDALMQILVCKKEIGWRDQSDKIVVVATDEEFHYAGDGKLGGIIVPNDGLCHMSGNNYTHYGLLDYPSMYQIAEKVRENKFNIVFTVASKVQQIYKTLESIIGSTAQVADLQEDDNTIVKLIERVYKEIRTSVELRIERMSEDIDIELYSKCLTSNRMKTSNCTFEGKPVIDFEAVVTLKRCPKQKSEWNQVIKIGLSNINEGVEIVLRMVCDCDCETKRAVPNSQECSGAGTYACGICATCNGIRTGDRCECDPDEPINPKDPDAHCKPMNITSVCNGRGVCECGKCKCIDGYSGKFCQYDDSNCYPKGDKNLLKCNGIGDCVEEKCNCGDDYTGRFCECPVSDSACIYTKDGKVCSGQGQCKCGKCVCNSSRIIGTYCQLQICPSCEAQEYCEKILNCETIICEELYGKGNCTEKCTEFETTIVDKFSDSSNSTGRIKPFQYQCSNRTLNSKCDIIFSYERTDDEIDGKKHFKITKPNKVCAEKVDLVVISSSVFAGIILIGLALLLLWKLITEILDRKEFARFQKELNKANWEQSENPLYKEVTTTFQNPTFGLRERGLKRLSRFTERISRRFDFTGNSNN